MARIEQINELLRQNAEYMAQLQTQQVEAMRQLLVQFAQGVGGAGGGGQGGAVRDLRERQFREINAFDGEESKWKEWSLKFSAAVKEASTDIYAGLKWAEAEPDELTLSGVKEKSGDVGQKHATMLYNRLIVHLGGGALAIYQTLPEDMGYEV